MPLQGRERSHDGAFFLADDRAGPYNGKRTVSSGMPDGTATTMDKRTARPDAMATSAQDSRPDPERQELESLMEWRARVARRRKGRALKLAATCAVAAGLAMLGALITRVGIIPSRIALREPDALPREATPSPLAEPRGETSQPNGPEGPSRQPDGSRQDASQPPADDDPASGQRERAPGASEAEGADTPADLDVATRPKLPEPGSDAAGSVSPGPDQPLSSRSSPANLSPDDVTHQSAERLAIIRRGDSKERVFDVFSTVFVKQRGKVIKVEGIRLRASGRSPRDGTIEVGEVVLADAEAAPTPYWFLFEDGRLLAWGRPDEWRPTATRYQIDLNYPGHPASADNGD
jgi:hypothetical protein